MESTFLVEIAAKGAIVLALAWSAALALRRAPAAVRAQVWAAAFFALFALPAIAYVVPSLRVPIAGAWAAPAVIANTTATAGSTVTSDAPSHPARSPQVPRRLDWTRAIVGLWTLGAAAMLARLLTGWSAASRAHRRSVPFLTERRDVDVRLTDSAGAPMQVGIFRPAILLPVAAREWTAERLRFVILHEMAHVERRDLATQMIARLALALHWWNPLAWIAWRALMRERECAADDVVLRAGAQPSAYAAHLLDIARSMRAGSPTTLAAAAMARETGIEHRFDALFDRSADRRPASVRHAFAAGLATVCLLIPLAATKAQIASTASKQADEALARRDYDAARAAMDAEIASMNPLSGVAYARALVKTAAIERRRGKDVAAADLYKQALAAAGDSPETAPALLALGQFALADRHFDDSMQLLERAERVGPESAGRAIVWQALVRERQGDAQTADALYKRALAIASPESPDRISVVNLYRRFLNGNGRATEAETLALPAAPAPQRNEDVYRIGAGIQAPKLVVKEEPAYTDEARIAKLDGTVALYVEIAPDGRARNIRVLKPLGLGLEDNAIDAVTRWRFEPGMKDGLPVTVAAQIEVNFRLL
jgi:TonB family protein